MAAEKECIMLCVDVGPSMRPPCMENAIGCLQWILRRRIFDQGQDVVGLLLFGGERTNNAYAELGQKKYHNVSVERPMAPANWDFFGQVSNLRRATPVRDVDFASAVSVAALQFEKSKGRRSIVLLSALGAVPDQPDVDCVAGKLQDDGIDLAIINCVQVECKSEMSQVSHKKHGLEMAQKLTDAVSGILCRYDQAISMLSSFRARSIRPVAFKCNLELGSRLKIPVALYVKCRRYKLKESWKYARMEDAYIDVKAVHTYCKFEIDDEVPTLDDSDLETEFTGTPVAEEDLVKAFRYGATVIPLSKTDVELTKYRSAGKGLQILGFMDACDVQPWQFTGDGSHLLFADATDANACRTLSALIRACKLEKKVPLIRYTYSAASNPRLCVLVPMDKADYECFAVIGVPFAEDLAPMASQFPAAKRERHQPSEQQLAAVDSLITCMDLNRDDYDDSGPFKWTKTKDPYYQHLFTCLESRVVNGPGQPLPGVSADCLAALRPRKDVLDAASGALDLIQKLFPLEAVAKTTKKRGAAEAVKAEATTSSSGEPSEKMSKVGAVVGLDEQQHLMADLEAVKRLDEDDFLRACQQMVDIIFSLLRHSSDLTFLRRAMTCTESLRRACIQHQCASVYEQFLRRLRTYAHSCASVKPWISELLDRYLGAISKAECSSSQLSSEDAVNFFAELGDLCADVKCPAGSESQ